MKESDKRVISPTDSIRVDVIMQRLEKDRKIARSTARRVSDDHGRGYWEGRAKLAEELQEVIEAEYLPDVIEMRKIQGQTTLCRDE